jgi:hypothetical protein
MPLFGGPDKAKQWEQEIRALREKRLAALASLLIKEAETLRAFGLALPTQISQIQATDLRCDYHKKPIHMRNDKDGRPISWCGIARDSIKGRPIHCPSGYVITYPEFILPDHTVFRWSMYGENYTTLKSGYAYYPELMPEHLQHTDPYQLLVEYPFRFFNRDPYETYKKYGNTERDRDGNKIGYIAQNEYNAETIISDPLEEVPGFTCDQLLRLASNRKLYLHLTGSSSNREEVLGWMCENWPTNTLGDDAITIKLLPPPETKAQVTAQFFDNLRTASHPIAFEIVSEETVYFSLTFAPQDRALIEQQLQLHFPSASAQQVTPIPQNLYRVSATPKLYEASLQTYSDFTIEPYNQLWGLLAQSDQNSPARVQIIVTPFHDSWLNCFQEIAEGKKSEKVISEFLKKYPAWVSSINLFASDPQLLSRLQQGFLRQFESPRQTFEASAITQVQKVDYRTDQWSILSTRELTALAHLPTQAIELDRLEIVSMKSKLPPELYTQRGAVIGQSTARGMTKTVTLPDSIRDRHTYIIGRSGSGKSTLLTNLIIQDIQAGKGVCVLDPHGELTESILDYIPQERVKDTIYLDVTDELHPIPLNILNAADTGNIALLVDDLVSTFKRLVDSAMWSSRMDALLRNSAQLLLRQPQPRAFLDIRKVLRNSEYRERLLQNVTYEPVKEFWEEDFPSYPKDAIQPILHRMSRFSDFPTLFAMLSTPKSKINFDEIMQQRKILLVNPAAGIIGDDNSKLIGCLIVSQLQLAAMRRAKIPQEERVPFSLYVDEFQNFIASPFDRILSEARKYQLCLTFAHQFISQLDDITRDAILGNVGTIVVLPINEKDAGMLRRSVGDYEITDILNLDSAKHEALCRPVTKASDTFSFVTSPPPQRLAQSNRQAIIERTRAVYGVQSDSPEPEAAPLPKPVAAVPQATGVPKFCPQCGSPAIAGGKFCTSCGNPFAAPVQPVNAPVEPTIVSPEMPLEKIRMPRPAAATPKTFASNREKVLYYLEQAQYLTTPQIISLCYTQKSNASADLSKLVSEKKIKEISNSRPKIYFIGAVPNVTDHNLGVRELFVKIVRSNFEIARIDFNLQLQTLNPDLSVDFVLPNGQIQKTFWEYDTGTEGTKELIRKVERYKNHSPIEGNGSNFGSGSGVNWFPPPPPPVIFVFKDSSIFNRVIPSIETPFTYGVVLSEFETMDDATFKSLFL